MASSKIKSQKVSETIRITDLADPELNELQQSIHAFGRTLNVTLDPGDILEEASNATGLEDFGAKDFRGRLDLLCNEWSNDQGLNNLGRMSLRNKLQLLDRLEAFLGSPRLPLGPADKGADVPTLAAWTAVSSVIMNLDEFLMRR